MDEINFIDLEMFAFGHAGLLVSFACDLNLKKNTMFLWLQAFTKIIRVLDFYRSISPHIGVG